MSAETGRKRNTNLSSENPTCNMVSDALPDGSGIRTSRPSKKGIAFGKRSNSMKRNPNAVVTKMGWLYKQASSGVKQWNKRWFVLVDRCLFYYKDEKEEGILGSIPLLSFRISPVQPSDNISRKYTFKVTVCWVGDEPLHNKAQMSRQAEHAGIRTYYFSAESREEQDSWVHVMGEASQVQNAATHRLEMQDSENIPPSRDQDPETRSRGEGDGRGSEKLERRSESSQLAKVNGSGTSSERIPELDLPRHIPEGEHPAQPNGWSFAPLPVRPAYKVFPEGNGQRTNLQRTQPEKLAQRQNSMSQLQQWVNLRRSAVPTEEIQSPNRYFPGSHHIPGYYSHHPSQYPDEYQYYTQAGSRPESICSMSVFDRAIPQWAVEDRQQIFNNRSSYEPQEWKDLGVYERPVELWAPRPALYYQEVDAACGSLRRLSIQPRSRSVPRSPSQGAFRIHQRICSPVRSPSARFEPASQDESFGDPSEYSMRRSISSPKYDYLGDRRPLPAGMYSYNYPASTPLHDKMKLLGRLCEQHKVVREQDRLVQQLRAEKESLESALMGTHQEMEMFGSQTAFPDKLLHRKESLQNQLISIRVELSQATTALNNSTMEYDILETEVSTLHDALWEQLNLNIQNELMNRHIQREIWRIQDVMEGLRKNNPSRGTDTAKHRVVTGPSATFTSNSPASPLSSASLTSPLSPFSLISGSQGSPTKHTTSEVKHNFERYDRESPHLLTSLTNEGVGSFPTKTDVETEKQWQLQQQAANKVGIVPPRTKSPSDEGSVTKQLVVRRGGNHTSNGQISRERPKSALFPAEAKSKMSVEEQIDRIKRHQSGSMKEKRRSLQLPSSQQTDPSTTKQAGTYRMVRRHRSIHEVDISDLEAAIRSQEPQKMYESPRDEIARLRKMELEPQPFKIDINRELSTPNKVLIPERYLDMEPESSLSPEELQEKQRKVERIKTLIAKSSLQNVIPLSDSELEMPQDPESQLQEQEKRIELSCALATEASRRGRLLSDSIHTFPVMLPRDMRVNAGEKENTGIWHWRPTSNTRGLCQKAESDDSMLEDASGTTLCATPSSPTSPTSPAPQISSEHTALGEGSNNSDSTGEFGENIMCV